MYSVGLEKKSAGWTPRMIGLQEFSGVVRRSRFPIGGLNLELLPGELISFSLYKIEEGPSFLMGRDHVVNSENTNKFSLKALSVLENQKVFFVGAEVMPEKIVSGKALDQSARTTW